MFPFNILKDYTNFAKLAHLDRQSSHPHAVGCDATHKAGVVAPVVLARLGRLMAQRTPLRQHRVVTERTDQSAAVLSQLFRIGWGRMLQE